MGLHTRKYFETLCIFWFWYYFQLLSEIIINLLSNIGTQATQALLAHTALIISKCSEAATIETTIQAILKKSMETKEKKGNGELHLMAAEKVLLSLASYPRCTECILYAMPLVLDVNGENNLYLR